MWSLALDASSKCVGLARLKDEKVISWDAIDLVGTIEERVEAAYNLVLRELLRLPYGVVTTEAPAVVHAGSAIPQLYVRGGIILACRHSNTLWNEVTPTEAKKALSGSGKASKEAMLHAAWDTLFPGETMTDHPKVFKKNDKFRIEVPEFDLVITEDAADAMGVGLAGIRKVKFGAAPIDSKVKS